MKVANDEQNVFLDCGFDPAEAENLRIRTDILIALTSHIGDTKQTKVKAARTLNISQSKLSELLNHHVESFTVDELLGMLTLAGLRVDLNIRPTKIPRKVA